MTSAIAWFVSGFVSGFAGVWLLVYGWVIVDRAMLQKKRGHEGEC